MRQFLCIALVSLSLPLAAWTGGASLDYLYWKPANLLTNNGTVQRVGEDGRVLTSTQAVDPTYQSGVRGEIWWSPECRRLAFIGRYSYVDADHSQRFYSEPVGSLIPVGVVPSLTRIRVESPYHAGDLLLGYQFSPCRDLRLDLLVGGHVLYWALDVRSRFDALGTPQFGTVFSDVASHSRFAGGGASVGVATVWDLFCGLEAMAELHLGVLYGSQMRAGWTLQEQVGLQEGVTFTVNTPFSFQTWTRELDVRLGARYNFQIGCADLGLQIGWESRNYLDLQQQTLLFGGSGGNLSIGGPFVGLYGSF